jgi:hypothetical protein
VKYLNLNKLVRAKLVLMKQYENKYALLYGIILGDGCISKVGNNYYFISVVGNVLDDLEFLNEVVKPLLESVTNCKIVVKRRIKQRKAEILFSDKEFFQRLMEDGFPVGKKGINLTIPAKFGYSEFRSIVKGYFATDGSLVITNNNGINYPRIEFSSISKPLLIQVLNYLNSIGMKGQIYVSKKYSDRNWNTLFRLQFNGKNNLEVFRDKISFVNPKHKEKYEMWKKSTNI